MPLLDLAFERQPQFRSILREADDPRNAQGKEGLTKAADADDAATPAGAAAHRPSPPDAAIRATIRGGL